MNIEQLLAFEEGYREKAYICSEGYPTIGIGTVIGTKGLDVSTFTLKVSKLTAMTMLRDELYTVDSQLEKLRWYNGLSVPRQTIIRSMCYQMGYTGVMKFKKMIAALADKDYTTASREALNSQWAKQTPARAIRHATVLECGDINEVYLGLA